MTDVAQAMAALAATVAELLDPPGCEWNRAQTHRSLVTYLVEESAELAEAIEVGTTADLREELGDVLYQVALHAGIAERAGEGFDLADVVAEVNGKIRRRHPHVFGAETAADVDDIVRLWSAAKAHEKASRASRFDGIPAGLPALARAQKVASRAAAGRGQQPESDAGETPGSGARAFDVSTEEAWGRALLAEVDQASRRGWDAERALRLAVRSREAELRKAELEETEHRDEESDDAG